MENNDGPLAVGILGAANIANKTIRGLIMSDQLQVVAVGSRNQSKAEQLLSRWGLSETATAYDSYIKVLDDPRVEAVYIPLPTTMHVEWVRAASAKGKHILLEKPIAVSPSEVDAIMEACSQAGVVFMDGTMWVHSERTARMKSIIDSGSLGSLRTVHSQFTFKAPPGFEDNVRMKKECDPLGALGDLGWYCIRAILWAYDYEHPLSVTAHAGAEFTADGVPVHIGATLLFSGGRRGSFECGFDRALTQSFEVLGTEGSLRLNDYVIPQSESEIKFIVSSNHGFSEFDVTDTTQREIIAVETAVPQEVTMWETFAKCVRKAQKGGEIEHFWAEISTITQKVVCAVEESARNGCVTVGVTV